MFEVNKKMMLCAAVGGDIEDYNKMIVTNLCYVQCPHFINAIISNYDKATFDKINNLNICTVQLEKLKSGLTTVGYVGKCKECGKIYYHIQK